MAFFGYTGPPTPSARQPDWNSAYEINDRDAGETVVRQMEWWWDIKRETYYEQLPVVDQALSAMVELLQGE